MIKKFDEELPRDESWIVVLGDWDMSATIMRFLEGRLHGRFGGLYMPAKDMPTAGYSRYIQLPENYEVTL